MKSKVKEGQTYVCKIDDLEWWTLGKEYKIVFNENHELVIVDDRGTKWYTFDVLMNHVFKLKDELLAEDPPNENLPMEKEQKKRIPDLIDNQPHYKNQGIEPIDLMRKNFSKEEFAGFLQGNVLKYMLRYKDKNGVEDLKKAKTYLTWLIEEEK